jgi:predicted MFS family arabinose efflux permease
VGLGFGTFWVLLNLYLKDLGEATIGRVIMAASGGTFLISLPAAALIDRFPTRAILICAAALASLAYIGQVLPIPLWGVLLASVLAGAAFTVHGIAAAPFFMRNSSPAERLDLFGMHAAVEILAGIIGAAGGGALARLISPGSSAILGLRITLILAGALVLLAIVPYLRIREPLPVPRRINLRTYFRARDWPTLRRLLIPRFLVGFGAGLVIPFLNLYFRNRFSLPPNTIGSIFAVSQFLTMAGFLLGPSLARRFGMVRAAVATELLSIPFFLVLAFTNTVWMAMGAFWLRGALMNMNQPISDNFAMEMVPKDQHAVTNSLNSLVWNMAWMISAQLGGLLIEHGGFKLPILITVGLYLSASTAYLTFFHDAERRVIEPRRRAEVVVGAEP